MSGLRALLVVLLAAAMPAAADPLVEYRASIAMREVNGDPDPASARPVELPVSLGSNPAWYRFAIAAPADASVAQAIFIPGSFAHLDVRFNGSRLGRTGGMNEPVPRGWRSVHLFEVPRNAWRADGNELLIRAGGDGAWTFAAPQVGPHTVAERAYLFRVIATAVAPFAVGVLVAILGAFVLALWLQRREETLYGYFGLASLLCGLHMAWWMLPSPPLPPPHNRILWNATYTFWVSVMTIFFLRMTGSANRLVERVLWAVALAGYPVLYTANLFDAFSPASVAWRGLAIAVITLALAYISVRALQHRIREHYVMIAVGMACVAFGVHDWWTGQTARGLMTRVPLMPYSGLLFTLLFGWLLAKRLNANVDMLATTHATLHARVEEKTRELEENYARLRTAERERAGHRERARILADMHDGLGGKLLLSLRNLREHAGGREAATALLRDCLDELRLTVDANDRHEGDLAALLAALRHRLSDRLAQAGISIDWRVGESPPVDALRGGGARELMRIVQDALANLLRHAGATRLRVETTWDASVGLLTLLLEDNGRGFDVAAARGREGGLLAMARRADALGAQLRIDSDSGGTRIRLVFSAFPSAAPVLEPAHA